MIDKVSLEDRTKLYNLFLAIKKSFPPSKLISEECTPENIFFLQQSGQKMSLSFSDDFEADIMDGSTCIYLAEISTHEYEQSQSLLQSIYRKSVTQKKDSSKRIFELIANGWNDRTDSYTQLSTEEIHAFLIKLASYADIDLQDLTEQIQESLTRIGTAQNTVTEALNLTSH